MQHPTGHRLVDCPSGGWNGFEKDNFEDDNELSRLEEEDELGGGDEIVETEEEEILITEEEPVAAAPAPKAASKPAAKPTKKAAPKKAAPRRRPQPRLRSPSQKQSQRKKRRRQPRNRRRRSGAKSYRQSGFFEKRRGLGHGPGLFVLKKTPSTMALRAMRPSPDYAPLPSQIGKLPKVRTGSLTK